MSGGTVRFVWGICCIFIMLLSGCKTLEGLRADLESYRTDVHKATHDVTQPTKNTSDYSASLTNLKSLILTQNVSPIYIAVEPIADQSASGGKLPGQVSMMVETALNRLGCRNIQLIPYSDAALSRPRRFPVFIVHGAITEYDADVESVSTGASAGAFFEHSGSSGDASADKEGGLSISSISIDFSLNNYQKNVYVPGLHVSNNMKLVRASSDLGFGFSIQGTGLNLNKNITHQTGPHKALRLLVELSMVELIGRYYGLPYWVCVFESNNLDQQVVDTMVRNFERLPLVEQAKEIQLLLNYVTDGNMKVDGNIGPRTKSIIRAYARNHRINYKDYSSIYSELIADTGRKFQKLQEDKL